MVIQCEDCKDRFHASCANLGNDELEKLKSGIETWYCSNCKADCGLCRGAVLGCHKAVQCDMWIHSDCFITVIYFITDSQFETMKNFNCTWICPKCDFFQFLGLLLRRTVKL